MDIRPAPITTRNGMPTGGGYVYRGWYIDIMPWANTDDCTLNYDTGNTDEEKRYRPVSVDERGRCGRCARVHTPVDAVDPSGAV
jgi:hypothetical protein